MPITRDEILRFADQEGARFLRLQFTDIMGVLKNVEIPRSQFEKALDGQILFDGSSIEGFTRIEESDMLLVPDFETGDGVAIIGRAEYTNERVLRSERRDPLEQHRTAHPVQGYMRCDIDSVLRLRALMHPRDRQLAAVINSASSTAEQAPR